MRLPIRVRAERKVQPETLILRAVRDYLQLRGWTVKRFQQGLGCDPGIPDLYAMRKGLGIWIEIKTPAGKLSMGQKEFEFDCQYHGIPFCVIRSIDEAMQLF